MRQILDWLNTLLVVDFFFVLASLAWLAIAVVGRTTGVALGLDVWYSLWEPLFTPAIGALMAGALLTGAIAQVQKWRQRREDLS